MPDASLLPIIGTQAGRCMDCGIPFCHQGCPLGNLIPEWNDLVWREDWENAVERLHATNNFPEFTGRLCPAPCETSCVLGINQDPVTIKNVEVAIADKGWDEGLVRPQAPEWLSGRTVAVVGSGPAGLAAAQQLTRAGHTVAVYERADKPGGLMRYGIPEFKMEKRFLDRRLKQMEREGTVFRTGVEIGRSADRTAAGGALRRGRAGDRRHRRRATSTSPDASSAGIHQAMDYLPQSNRVSLGEEVEDQVVATGKDVVIIGGGDTGADCLGTALRQGAASVTQLEIMAQPGTDRAPAHPWPTYPMIFRVSSAHEEGGERVYSASTKEFLGDDEGNVRAISLVEVDEKFQEIEGTEREVTTQLVLFAMGFLGPEKAGLVEQLGVEPRPARQRGARRVVPGVRARCLRGRRRRSRPVPDRLGDRRGPRLRRRRRHLPHRCHDPARPDPADRTAAGRLTESQVRRVPGTTPRLLPEGSAEFPT